MSATLQAIPPQTPYFHSLLIKWHVGNGVLVMRSSKDYGKEYGKEESRQAFDALVASGLTFIDTAEVGLHGHVICYFDAQLS